LAAFLARFGALFLLARSAGMGYSPTIIFSWLLLMRLPRRGRAQTFAAVHVCPTNPPTKAKNSGTIARGSGVSEVFGNLNPTAASFLDFGTGAAGTMTFGTYTPGSLLTINNFTQVNTLVFGSDLTSSINDTSLFTITAIPEASTYVAALGLLALGALPLVRRKRAKVS